MSHLFFRTGRAATLEAPRREDFLQNSRCRRDQFHLETRRRSPALIEHWRVNQEPTAIGKRSGRRAGTSSMPRRPRHSGAQRPVNLDIVAKRLKFLVAPIEASAQSHKKLLTKEIDQLSSLRRHFLGSAHANALRHFIVDLQRQNQQRFPANRLHQLAVARRIGDAPRPLVLDCVSPQKFGDEPAAVERRKQRERRFLRANRNLPGPKQCCRTRCPSRRNCSAAQFPFLFRRLSRRRLPRTDSFCDESLSQLPGTLRVKRAFSSRLVFSRRQRNFL